jgi:tRNA (guanine-N7-)-methyltransferase
VNPYSDRRYDWCPYEPSEIGYAKLYPQHAVAGAAADDDEQIENANENRITFADVGCGYGGLTVALGKLYTDKLVLGMEIRPKVVAYVRQRIDKLHEAKEPGSANISVEVANVMKYLPCYFEKGQLEKLFFLFPDPHFKKKKHSWRIISINLLAEYAYALRVGGILYTITDVLDLHQWMAKHLDAHPLFERLTDQEQADDPCTPLVCSSSEEANKVERSSGSKYPAFYRRIADPLLAI